MNYGIARPPVCHISSSNFNSRHSDNCNLNTDKTNRYHQNTLPSADIQETLTALLNILINMINKHNNANPCGMNITPPNNNILPSRQASVDAVDVPTDSRDRLLIDFNTLPAPPSSISYNGEEIPVDQSTPGVILLPDLPENERPDSAILNLEDGSMLPLQLEFVDTFFNFVS